MDRKSHVYYYPPDDYEDRCRKRLQKELGVNSAGADVILHMRRQILEMQERIRQMEAELISYRLRKETLLGHYQIEYYEAYWRDIDSPPEENPEG